MVKREDEESGIVVFDMREEYSDSRSSPAKQPGGPDENMSSSSGSAQDDAGPSPTAGSIAGRVYDKATYRTIEDALVTVSEALSVKTDERGKFLIDGVEPGTYRVKVFQEGYIVQSQRSTVVTGETSQLKPFHLVPECLAAEYPEAVQEEEEEVEEAIDTETPPEKVEEAPVEETLVEEAPAEEMPVVAVEDKSIPQAVEEEKPSVVADVEEPIAEAEETATEVSAEIAEAPPEIIIPETVQEETEIVPEEPQEEEAVIEVAEEEVEAEAKAGAEEEAVEEELPEVVLEEEEEKIEEELPPPPIVEEIANAPETEAEIEEIPLSQIVEEPLQSMVSEPEEAAAEVEEQVVKIEEPVVEAEETVTEAPAEIVVAETVQEEVEIVAEETEEEEAVIEVSEARVEEILQKEPTEVVEKVVLEEEEEEEEKTEKELLALPVAVEIISLPVAKTAVVEEEIETEEEKAEAETNEMPCEPEPVEVIAETQLTTLTEELPVLKTEEESMPPAVPESEEIIIEVEEPVVEVSPEVAIVEEAQLEEEAVSEEPQTEQAVIEVAEEEIQAGTGEEILEEEPLEGLIEAALEDEVEELESEIDSNGFTPVALQMRHQWEPSELLRAEGVAPTAVPVEGATRAPEVEALPEIVEEIPVEEASNISAEGEPALQAIEEPIPAVVIEPEEIVIEAPQTIEIVEAGQDRPEASAEEPPALAVTEEAVQIPQVEMTSGEEAEEVKLNEEGLPIVSDEEKAAMSGHAERTEAAGFSGEIKVRPNPVFKGLPINVLYNLDNVGCNDPEDMLLQIVLINPGTGLIQETFEVPAKCKRGEAVIGGFIISTMSLEAITYRMNIQIVSEKMKTSYLMAGIDVEIKTLF